MTGLSASPNGFDDVDSAIVGTRHMHGTNPYDRSSADPAAMTNEVALAYRRGEDGKVHVFEIDAEQELSVIVDTMAISDPAVEAIVIDGSLYRPSETVVNEVGEEARLFEYQARSRNVAELEGGKLPTALQSAGSALAGDLTEKDSYYAGYTFSPLGRDWEQAIEYASYDDAVKGLHADDEIKQGAIVSVTSGDRTGFFAGSLSSYEDKDIDELYGGDRDAPVATGDAGTMKVEALFQGSGSDWKIREFD